MRIIVQGLIVFLLLQEVSGDDPGSAANDPEPTQSTLNECILFMNVLYAWEHHLPEIRRALSV